MKRKLQWIQRLFSISYFVSTVVACFPQIDLDYIMNRKNDTTSFATNGINLTTFNALDTTNVADLKILANLHSSPVSVDTYYQNFGDIATQSKPNKTLVGVHSDDYKIWTYYINPPEEKQKRYWYDWKGQIKREMTAHDFLNALKYSLNSKNITAESAYLWDNLVGYQTIRNHFSEKTILDYVNDPIWKQLGAKVTNDYMITFTFLKPYQAFESLLTSVQTTLLPQEAFLIPNYGKDYRDVWYSGAYIIADYQPGNYLKLRKNDNYWFANNTYIKNLTFHFLKDSQPAMLRSLFEQGDLSETKVDPNDILGWKNRYVGSDIKNPKYEGTQLEESTERFSYFIIFNFLNNAIDATNNPAKKQQAINAGKALQNQAIRNWIRYYLNRNTAYSYKTKNIENRKVSSLIINSYTHPQFKPFDGGYNINYMNNLYAELTKSMQRHDPGITQNEVETMFAPGQDPFFRSKTNSFGLKSTTKAAIREWLQTTIRANKVVLTVLVQAGDLEQQKAILDTIDQFNEIDKNDPIVELKPVIVKDAVESRKMWLNGDYDLYFGSGWGPDDNSVTSYLVAQKINGGNSSFKGLGKLFANLKYDDGTAPPWEQVVKNHYLSQLQNSATKTFYEQLREVHNLIVKSQNEISPKTQFLLAAQAEVKLVYDYNLLIPLGYGGLRDVPILTYVIPYTQAKVSYGTSKFKFWGVKLSAKLLNRAEQDKYKAIYQTQLKTIVTNSDNYEKFMKSNEK